MELPSVRTPARIGRLSFGQYQAGLLCLARLAAATAKPRPLVPTTPRTTPIEPLSDYQRSSSVEPGDPEARRLEQELLRLKIEEHQRANAIAPVVKQQGPGTRAPTAFLATFHVENLGDRNFLLKDYWCEVLPSDTFRKQFSAPAYRVEPLRCKAKLKPSQLVKPGEVGQLSLRLALEDIRLWFPSVGMPNPSIWQWTYVDLWIHVRCEGGGNEMIHHERIT